MDLNWEQTYQQKLMSADDAAALIESGDSIFAGGTSAIPFDFAEALAKRREELTGVTFMAGLCFFPLTLAGGEFKGHIDYYTIFSTFVDRKRVPEGNVNQLSVHLSEIGRSVRERFRSNVMAVHVSPPDAHGWMTFGPAGGLGQDVALAQADKVILVVQPTMPRCPGEFNMVHVDQATAIVETERPVFMTPPGRAEDPVGDAIAALLEPMIDDGSTIQIGIGKITGVVARGLAGKKDLGIHTEMLTDDMYGLIAAGAVTGARKNVMPGKVVYGFAQGSEPLMRYLDDNPETVILPLAEVLDTHECGKNDNFVSINTCLMVSVTGQVAAEGTGWAQISGTGGQLDLVRAARASKGGKSFIVFPSTRTLKSGKVISSISVGLPPGTPVTTPRTDVEYIATEFGVVNLRYKSNAESAAAMISIAHPDFREELRAALVDQGLEIPDNE